MITYFKSPKISDNQNVCCNYLKIQTRRYFHREMCPIIGTDGMANSVDPDQTAPRGSR